MSSNGTSEASLLQQPGFVRLWLVGALASTARWLELLVVGIFVFDQTQSPFLVATMVVLRLLPMGLFGLFGGVLAERFDRGRVLRFTMSGMAVISVTLGILTVTGDLAIWHVGVGVFCAGMAWITDFPVRRTLLADMAGPSRTGRAMSLDITSTSGTRMLGPLMGGGIYALIGLDGAFFVSAIAYGLALLTLIGLRPDAPSRTEPDASIRTDLAIGLRRLRDDRLLIGVFAVTIVFNVWCFPFVSMIPVFAREVLGLGPFATGLLASAEGAGALMGALGLALVTDIRYARYLYWISVVVYAALAILFSMSTVTVLSAAFLLGAGVAGAAFASTQSALVLLNSGAGRRQMMGVLSMCIGTGPLGLLHLGLLADWLGAPLACATVAGEGLLAMAWVLHRWPELRSLQPREL